MILDAGVLISAERGERAALVLLDQPVTLRTSEAVVGQVWRDGARQSRLARFLRAVEVHPLDDGRAVGRLLHHSGTADVVDAHVALLGVRLGDDVITSDTDDLAQVTAPMPQPPRVIPWPPTGPQSSH